VDSVTAHAPQPAVANTSLADSPSQALDNAVLNSTNSGIFYAMAAGHGSEDARNTSPARAGTTDGIMTVAWRRWGPERSRLVARRRLTDAHARLVHIVLRRTVLSMLVGLLSIPTLAQSRVGSGAASKFPLAIAVEVSGTLLVTDVDLRAVLRVDPVTGDRTVVSR
jgi:hypothetical protein